MSFNIIGTGSCLPQTKVTNDDLSKIVDTSDEWIMTRTGIKERRVCTDETAEELAISAAKRALQDANIDGQEIDAIICSSVTTPYLTPSLACLVAGGIDAKCTAFDVNAACAGFLYALDVADSFFKAGKANKILVVSAEQMTRAVDWTDRATCVLFGDGAGAVVLTKGDGVVYSNTTCISNKTYINIHSYGQQSPFSTNQPIKPKLYMDGGNVMKFAVNAMSDGIKTALEKSSLTIDDVTYILPHQANMRILRSATRLLKIPEEKVLSNIELRANISSACIPVLMDECNKKGMFKKGDLLALSAFGGGLTIATMLLRW